MSDPKSIDALAKSIRDGAGDEAEARWRAEEERKARNLEAHTAYMITARQDLLTREDRNDARHSEVIGEFDRQTSAMLRIAAALEAMVSK